MKVADHSNETMNSDYLSLLILISIGIEEAEKMGLHDTAHRLLGAVLAARAEVVERIGTASSQQGCDDISRAGEL